MNVTFSAAELAELTQAIERRGATAQTIVGLAALADAGPGDLSFLGNAKYKADVAKSRAAVILIPRDYVGEPAADQLYLVVANPSVALATVCARIEQQLWPKVVPGVHPTAVLGEGVIVPATATIGPLCVLEPGVRLGERVHLQAQVFVGRNAAIGDDCWLMPRATVAAECVLGNRVRLQAGVVVGSDGFGYEFVKGRHEKVPQVGIVRVGDDVEIGANSTIDRARFSRTEIGEGTKIDNLVQIAHNVRIGRHCLICAQAGISGSTTLGDYVVLGGQAGLGGHITLGKGVKAGGQAGITSDVAAGEFVNGTPAIPYMLERRLAILHQRLPDLFKRVETLERQIVGPEKSSS